MSSLSFFSYWLTFDSTPAIALPSLGTDQTNLHPMMSKSDIALTKCYRTIDGCYMIMMIPMLKKGKYFVSGDVEWSGSRESLPVRKFSL